jgi:hypothetical protein
MGSLGDLFRRADRLQRQVDSMREEIKQIRDEMRLMEGPGVPQESNPADSLTVAMSSAIELGEEFSSECAHDVADRGGAWFHQP